MKTFKIKIITASLIILLVLGACHDLSKLNINPNGPDPATTDLNLLLPTAIVGTGQNVIALGFGDIAGVMQHMQETGWQTSFNFYEWNSPGQSWAAYYNVLRNADEFYQKAVQDKHDFHQGVGLVLKAYTFGMIADLWGDAPYSQALMAEEGSQYYQPVFDSQQHIYHGILADLETANTLLSKDNEYELDETKLQDVLYSGDASKWRKFANSLALRYYMRLQAKEPAFAQAGISKIASAPSTYPLITSADDDANVSFPGTNAATSWVTQRVFGSDAIAPDGEYLRRKPCATLVDTLKAYNDPRIAVWFDKVPQPLVLVAGTAINQASADEATWQISSDVAQAYINHMDTANTVNGVLGNISVNYSTDYIGIPAGIQLAAYYNLQPISASQGYFNPHISQLNSMYQDATGDLLQMRLLSAAEINFILAEAVFYGWISGDAATYYANGVKESFNAWGVGSQFGAYITGAPYNGLESIMLQKWIASFSSAAESWFDWRRTGLPNLQAGPLAMRTVLPIRFYYDTDEDYSSNTANYNAAVAKLEPTPYKLSDPTNNSAWSRTWLLQGTGKPY